MPPGTLIKAEAVYDRPFWRDAGSAARRQRHRPGQHDVRQQPAGRRARRAVRLHRRRRRREPPRWRRPRGGRRCSRTSSSSSASEARAAHGVLRAATGPTSVDPRLPGRPHRAGACCAATAPALRKPSARMHWAGTETADYWNGYMDGAVRSASAPRARCCAASSAEREHELADRPRVAVGEPAVLAVEELERVLDAELVELRRERLRAEVEEVLVAACRRRGRCAASSAARRRAAAPSAPGPCPATAPTRRRSAGRSRCRTAAAPARALGIGRVARRRSRTARTARSGPSRRGRPPRSRSKKTSSEPSKSSRSLRAALRELRQVAALEQRVAGVRGQRAEHVRAQHRHDHRAVAARRLAGQPAVVAARRASGSARRRTARPRRTGSRGSGRCSLELRNCEPP